MAEKKELCPWCGQVAIDDGDLYGCCGADREWDRDEDKREQAGRDLYGDDEELQR